MCIRGRFPRAGRETHVTGDSTLMTDAPGTVDERPSESQLETQT